ncbi:N-acetylglucosamine-6-phosphate deacetylase [Falsirhodobacter halotolerans]|nr:N-acetylglucosamine-6-phosphate deacetylase [Falsirhodobacter halotolerans]
MTAFRAARIFDGERWHDDTCLVVTDGRVDRIGPAADAVPVDGWIVPGFVDLQVNGGGGVQFNDDPTPQGIAAIAAAHARFGTTSLMVTLITDRPEVTARAIDAAAASDVMGLHLEGPHFAPTRVGTHDPALVRPMADGDLDRLTEAARRLRLIVTLAPEIVGPNAIAALVRAGAIVSLGHSDATLAQARRAAEGGATMVTHLFNAMSPLSHRTPGLVGAALDDGRLWTGIIADGHHLDDAALGIALRAKRGPARLFLVSDAMATVGSDRTGFTLNGRAVHRADGCLRLADGTLAGADIALIDAARHLLALGTPVEEVLRMASTYPAQAVADPARGGLHPGQRADFLSVTPDLGLKGVWIGGVAA